MPAISAAPAGPLTEALVIRETVEWQDVHLAGDAPGALVRVEPGGTLRWTGGSLERTASWGSLVHVAGGVLELSGVRLSGAVEHHLLPEPRPEVVGRANHHGSGAVLVTDKGTATLGNVEASGRAPSLRGSGGSAKARACTLRGEETCVVNAGPDAHLVLEGCDLHGGIDALFGRVLLEGGTVRWARAAWGAQLELRGAEVLGMLRVDGARLTLLGGTGTSEGTVVFLVGKGRLRMEDFTLTSAGGRGLELQGASSATVKRCRITGTKLDGIAAFDAATLTVEDTHIENTGGHPILLAGASDGPEGAVAIEFARPGGPGCDPVELLRSRLDEVATDARHLFVERVSERSGDASLRDWATSARQMGATALDLREQPPVAKGEGAVVAIQPVSRGLWFLTGEAVYAVLDGEQRRWKLPRGVERLAADEDGAVVCGRDGLFVPLAKTTWPLQLRGPLSSLSLTFRTIVIEGGEDSGHPTDRSNWRLVVDRATGQPGELTLTGQGGFTGAPETTSVQTLQGEARLFEGTLTWQGRTWHLPGGITTLAADGDALLVGTAGGAVYRLR